MQKKENYSEKQVLFTPLACQFRTDRLFCRRETQRSFSFSGSGIGIRTPINGTKTRCPAVRRSRMILYELYISNRADRQLCRAEHFLHRLLEFCFVLPPLLG